MLGWLMSDGAEVDNIGRSLKDTIQSYNSNFEKIQHLDDQIMLSYNHITEKLQDMSEKEILLRDLLVSEQIKTQLARERQQFINVQSQHYIAISNMIEHSDIHEALEMISRSLFHQNVCNIHICEIGIFSLRDPQSTKITVHREVLKLEENQDFLITCEALSSTHISSFHNKVGQKISEGTLILNNKIILEANLLNKTLLFVGGIFSV